MHLIIGLGLGWLARWLVEDRRKAGESEADMYKWVAEQERQEQEMRSQVVRQLVKRVIDGRAEGEAVVRQEAGGKAWEPWVERRQREEEERKWRERRVSDSRMAGNRYWWELSGIVRDRLRSR